MIRKLTAFAFLLISFIPAYADERIDSLTALLKTQLSDSTRVRAYIDLAYQYRFRDSQKSYHYLDLAEELSQQISFTKGTNSSMRVRAMLYAREENYTKSFELIYKAIDEAEKDKDILLLSACYLSLGDILLNNRSYELAQKYISKAYECSFAAGDIFSSGYTKRMLANISFKKGDYKTAAEEFKEAYRFYVESGKQSYTNGVLNDIGLCYVKMREYDVALKYFNEALEVAKEHDRDFIGIIKGNIGEIYMLRSEYDQAIAYLKADADYNRGNMHEVSSLVNTYSQLAHCYDATNNLPVALKYIDSALSFREIRRVNHDYLVEALKIKSRILVKAGNYAEANKAITQAMSIRESEHTADENVSVLEKQVGNEAMRKEKELEQLKTKLSVEKRLGYYYIIIAVLSVCVVSIAFYSTYRSRRSYKVLHDQYQVIEKQQKELDEKQREIEKTNTNLVTVNEKLTELNEEKNEFIRLVAHDLKNPLGRISGLTYLIEMEPDNKVKEETEKLEHIKSSVSEMTSLIERFLDVNRIESGQQKINVEEIDLSALLNNETEHFRIQAREKLIDLNFISPQSAVKVSSDPQILRLIFTNLLSNAIKFSSFNKPIEITTGQENGNVFFSVRDYGPGMTEQDKHQVFKKYTRLSARPTGNETSTGLGLYLVKKMCEKINASVSFESTLGLGTEMTVTIPAKIA